MPTIYFKNSQNKWFDGYANQTKILIDELPKEASKWCMTYLKKWTDKLPCLVDVKGTTTYARWDHVIVTC